MRALWERDERAWMETLRVWEVDWSAACSVSRICDSGRDERRERYAEAIGSFNILELRPLESDVVLGEVDSWIWGARSSSSGSEEVIDCWIWSCCWKLPHTCPDS